jgi:hypothetical protein
MANNYDKDSRYSILVDLITYKEFEKARERLGLSASTYLKNLMGKDFTVQVRFKHVDLGQTKIQENNKNE